MSSATPSPARHRTAGAPFLLDTHIWVWYLIGSDRLPVRLRETIDQSLGRLWLSPMSVWEVGMLAARGRLELLGGTRDWCARAHRALPTESASLTGEVALRSHELDLDHRDPVDRLLAATALVHGLTLMTADERLISADWLPTVHG